jgi:hypothetical protein
VRVHHDGIGPPDALEPFPAFLAEQEKPTIRRIQVEPEAVLFSDAGDVRNRVDRPGVGGAG